LKAVQAANTTQRHLHESYDFSSKDESTEEDDNADESVKQKSQTKRTGEAAVSVRSSYAARLPHVKPMTNMPICIDSTYSHLMIFNRLVCSGAMKLDEGSERMPSTRITLWGIYAAHLWEPKRSSRASARLLHALSRFQPPSTSFGVADAHIIYAQLQSYSTNRIYPWRQAFEFASDCPAMTFSMFCEATATISRRWYPRETPLDSLNAFLSVPNERYNLAEPKKE
jgi:hypothetical protein